MTGSWILNSPSVISNAMQALNSVDPDQGFVMTIAKEKDRRSSAQNRLKWTWMQQVAREMAGSGYGYDAQRWNDYFKGRYMSDLLLSQDGDWRFYFDGANSNWQSDGDKMEFYRLVGKPLETKDLTVKNMSEFMGRIDTAAQSKGIQLITPSDLEWSVG